MTEPYAGLEAILGELPDTFVLNEPTLSPVIPPGAHGLMYYVAQLAPVQTAFGKKFRDMTWNLAIISPVTGMEAARPPLLAALNQVIDVLETHSDTVRWTEATLEPFADTLWCYSINIQMYAETVQEEE